MLLTLDYPRVGTGFAISRIPKALRFVLYLNNYIISNSYMYSI